jgi:leucyl aminopeptidase
MGSMRVEVVQGDIVGQAGPLLVVGVAVGEGIGEQGVLSRLDTALDGMLGQVLGSGDFKGKEGQTALLYPTAGRVGAERVLLVGLGNAEDLTAERFRRAGGTAVKQAIRLEVESFACSVHRDGPIERAAAGRAVAEGIVLGGYVFDEMKSGGEEAPQRRPQSALLLDDEAGEAVREAVRVGAAVAGAENLARTLGNLPANVATPGYLAEQAREVADRHDMRCEILGRAELEREELRTILAVAQGSDQEPKLIVLEHRGGRDDEQPLLLVGKGLTFDSGGISIKPSAGMEEMKFDMCGGAAVLGAMEAIGELRVPINVVALVPSSENLLSGSAVKPGDIVKSHLGKTIEVINTDAEGRLILADALSYGRRFEPAAIVDVATLTGSCVIALGNQASGGMGNDDRLLEEIRAAGDRVHERVWPLPMYDEYREQIRSDYADIKNSGGRGAGTITGGWFLREFVGDTPWVHLDIAGTASGDGKLSYQTKGATGVPTRLLVEWVLSRAG